MRKSDQLSIGQTQRVALARAFTLSPEVLLLDEPTSALDEESAANILGTLLRRNRDTGITLIIVTHAREILTRLDCPVLLLHDGHATLLPDAPAALDSLRRLKTEMG
ncbi:MAG: Arginine transport ATP-binding protein ArtP [bacterium ADurb.Bin429]|nr:MAG: Arginine transport ATP-binding protein ArtP [bacterium ADurb.Bin429]